MLIVVVGLLAGLRNALDRARGSEQASREFLAFAAHQLRTPIAGARAAAEALILQGASPSQESLLQRITAETARSGRLVASLLRVARMDQGEFGVLRSCDIRTLVTEEVERLRSRMPLLDVALDVAPSVPAAVVLSPEATQETLESLLDNARKHATQLVSVSIAATADELQIRITDDGAGVPPGEEDRVFERFVTLDGLGGSGLGLPIARGLTEGQGGQLHYRDRSFLVQLPL
jgi:signal transduction histidine kinase